MKNKSSPLEYKNPLHPKNVDPKNKEEVKRFIKEQLAYAKILEKSPSTSPFASPFAKRTHKEPY